MGAMYIGSRGSDSPVTGESAPDMMAALVAGGHEFVSTTHARCCSSTGLKVSGSKGARMKARHAICVPRIGSTAVTELFLNALCAATRRSPAVPWTGDMLMASSGVSKLKQDIGMRRPTIMVHPNTVCDGYGFHAQLSAPE